MEGRRSGISRDFQRRCSSRLAESREQENRPVLSSVVSEWGQWRGVIGCAGSLNAHPVDFPLHLEAIGRCTANGGRNGSKLGRAVFDHAEIGGRLGHLDGGILIRSNDGQFGQRKISVTGRTGALGLKPNVSPLDARRKIEGNRPWGPALVLMTKNFLPVTIENQQPEVVVSHPAGIEQSLAFIRGQGSKPDLQATNALGRPQINLQPAVILRPLVNRDRPIVEESVDVSVVRQSRRTATMPVRAAEFVQIGVRRSRRLGGHSGQGQIDLVKRGRPG